MNKKIEKYAADPVVFYLHKNRNFIKKIQDAKYQYKEQIR